jgi:hypothetical protein
VCLALGALFASTISKVNSHTGPAYPFHSPIAPETAVGTATYNSRALCFKNYENAFFWAKTILRGRDSIEEFVAARVWPLLDGWKPSEIVFLMWIGLLRRCCFSNSI